MAPSLEPLKKHQCTKKGCAASYNDLRDLYGHMNREPDHDFCTKCKFLAVDWDDLIVHKIKSPLAHITCKFCGEDFKTGSGRDRHIKQRHPVNQDLRCIGCGERFNRAALVVQHLEFGHCPKISAEQFRNNLQHKHLIQALLEDPNARTRDWDARDTGSVAGGIPLSAAASESGYDAGTSIHESSLLDDDTTTDGGSLLDYQAGGSLVKPMVPESVSDAESMLSRRYPALPVASTGRSSASRGQKTFKTSKASNADEISSLMSGASLNGTGSSKTGGVPLPSGALNPTECTWSNGLPEARQPTARDLFSDTASDTTEKAPTQADEGNSVSGSDSVVWGNSARRLFANAKPTPINQDWEAALRVRDQQYQQNDRDNMFRASFWDPTHKDYDPDRFFNPILEKYECPFNGCQQNYEQPYHIQLHIGNVHAVSQVRCPTCLKLFKSTFALVSHCEAAVSRCRIGSSSGFGQAIDRFTGGFLGVEEIWRPDVSEEERKDRPEKEDDIRKEKMLPGSGIRIHHNKYETTLPPDFQSGEPPKQQVGRTYDTGAFQGNNAGMPTSASMQPADDTEGVYQAQEYGGRPTYMRGYLTAAETRASKNGVPEGERFPRPVDANELGVMSRSGMQYASQGGQPSQLYSDYEPTEPSEYDEYNE